MVLPRSRSWLADDIRVGDRLFLGLLLALLLAGTLWVSRYPIALRIRAIVAHVEPTARVHTVAPDVSGRVLSLPIELGDEVALGDPLLILDAEHEEEQLNSGRKRLAGLENRLLALQAETSEELSRLDLEIAAAEVDEASAARQALGDATTQTYAERGLQQSERLLEIGLVSQNERLRLEVEAARTRSVADVAALAHKKAVQRLAAARRARQAREAAFAGAIGLVRGQIEEARSDLVHFDEEVRRRTLRAPVAGVVRELQQLGPGSVLAAGEKIARIVPRGPGQVVLAQIEARYLPRLHAGLPAEVREVEARGGPGEIWPAEVVAIGVPDADSRSVRVELKLLGGTLAVGAPVRVDIEIEKMPLALSLLETLRR